MTQEEKERKSFGKFKGIIYITGKTHADKYNTAIKENKKQKLYGGKYVYMKHYDKYEKECILIIFYNVSIIFKNLKLYKINKQRTNIIAIYILELN